MWTGRGVKGRVWTATSGIDPLVWDLRSSSRLVLGFLCCTIVSGMSEGSWMSLTWAGRRLKVALGESGDWGWLKASKSSLESETSTTLIASSRTKWEEVATSSTLRWEVNFIGWVSAGGGPVRKPGTAMLIWCSQRSFALITYLGAWKLVEMGLYPRIRWAARSCSSICTKILD